MSQPVSLSPWSASMADVLNASTFTALVFCGHRRRSVGRTVLRSRTDIVRSAQYLAQWESWAVSGLQNAAKWYSIKTLVFRAHTTKKHLWQAWGKKGSSRRLFFSITSAQRISLGVSLGYLFCIMMSDISQNMKAICKLKTKSKMVLENDSLWRLIFILLHMRLVKQTGLF